MYIHTHTLTYTLRYIHTYFHAHTPLTHTVTYTVVRRGLPGRKAHCLTRISTAGTRKAAGKAAGSDTCQAQVEIPEPAKPPESTELSGNALARSSAQTVQEVQLGVREQPGNQGQEAQGTGKQAPPAILARNSGPGSGFPGCACTSFCVIAVAARPATQEEPLLGCVCRAELWYTPGRCPPDHSERSPCWDELRHSPRQAPPHSFPTEQSSSPLWPAAWR